MSESPAPVSSPLLSLKRLGRRVARSVGRRLLPSYAYRWLAEWWIYRSCTCVHDLPPIFHYWSNRYLRPKFENLGFSGPDQFFEMYLADHCRAHPGRTLAVLSIGAGNCDLEVELARRLTDAGLHNFHVNCLDLNRAMLARGRKLAAESGLEKRFRFQAADFNRWTPDERYDVVIANQVLHHVQELEHLLSSIRAALADDGRLLTSDMIGRNGHLRWPEARAALEPFWTELPQAYKRNHLRHRIDDEFRDRDCSLDSFEGIRAQEILPLLVENFEFELFAPFGNLIFVFVERTYGPNFDPERDWDRAFIDRVADYDERAILAGELTPTQMIAALTLQDTETKLLHPTLTPEFCIRRPGQKESGEPPPVGPSQARRMPSRRSGEGRLKSDLFFPFRQSRNQS